MNVMHVMCLLHNVLKIGNANTVCSVCLHAPYVPHVAVCNVCHAGSVSNVCGLCCACTNVGMCIRTHACVDACLHACVYAYMHVWAPRALCMECIQFMPCRLCMKLVQGVPSIQVCNIWSECKVCKFCTVSSDGKHTHIVWNTEDPCLIWILHTRITMGRPLSLVTEVGTAVVIIRPSMKIPHVKPTRELHRRLCASVSLQENSKMISRHCGYLHLHQVTRCP